MKKAKVPQDKTSLEYIRELCYAIDENGKYIKVQSSGWEAKDTALNLAWEALNDELKTIIEQVRAGTLSPLAFYLAKNQMDHAMLAGYIGIPARKIKKHTHPKHFAKLDEPTLQAYADFFRVTIQQLQHPEMP